MRRFLEWLLGRNTEHGTRAHVSVIDLPAEFGARMKLEEVRGVLRDPKHRACVHALAQVLWMNRSGAQQEAMDAAEDAASRTPPVFHLGQMAMVDGILADVQRLQAEFLIGPHGEARKWEGTEAMVRWFLAESEV
jgi:hypothetical protein